MQMQSTTLKSWQLITKYAIWIILLVLCIILVYKYIPTRTIKTEVKQEKHIRDSLNIVNDTIQYKIITLEKHYETIRNTITTQSINSDCVYFSDYLSKDSKRFSDTINIDTTKAN